jgi:hypothetical protein
MKTTTLDRDTAQYLAENGLNIRGEKQEATKMSAQTTINSHADLTSEGHDFDRLVSNIIRRIQQQRHDLAVEANKLFDAGRDDEAEVIIRDYDELAYKLREWEDSRRELHAAFRRSA